MSHSLGLWILTIFLFAFYCPDQSQGQLDRQPHDSYSRPAEESIPWIRHLIPDEWVQWALGLPGSAYVIAFIYWLRHPIILCFLLPMLLVLFIYLTILAIHLCRLRFWLMRQVTRWWSRHRDHHHDLLSPLNRDDLIGLAQLMKRVVAALWDAHGRIFHGYEVVGMEKLPSRGPAFVVYYHGTCPFDAYYLASRFCIERDRFIIPVVDRFLFRVPGMRRLLDLVGALEGTVEECAACLNPSLRRTPAASTMYQDNPDGGILLLAPGGVREALFADESYSVLWGERCGFAKVALRAQQPIYPMFTENIRETIRVVQFGKSYWRWLYEVTRLPVALFYGYFPVKLRTYIGDPVVPFVDESPEHLASRTKRAIEMLINEHQHLPPNLFLALCQRVPMFDRWFQHRRRSSHHH